MVQENLFEAHLLRGEDAKRGKNKCPICKRTVRWYTKTLDKRLVAILGEVMCYTGGGFESFKIKSVFYDDHHKINDCQKLHYWNFIKRNPKSLTWKITRHAIDFMEGKIQVPHRLWVFNNEVMEEEDMNMTHIGNLDYRWQIQRSDWSMDYIPALFKMESK